MDKDIMISCIDEILWKIDQALENELVDGMEICAEQFDKLTLIHEEFRGVRQQLEESK